MECTGKLGGLSIDYVSGHQKIEIVLNEDIRQEYDHLKNKEKLSVKIVQYRAKRSLNANRYFHELVGKVFRVNLVMRGSHTYDTKEMSRLIEGTVEEAKALGIETKTPEEIREMEERWGVKFEKA